MLHAAVGQLAALWAAEGWGGSTEQQQATKRREVAAETPPAPGEQLQDRRVSGATGLGPPAAVGAQAPFKAPRTACCSAPSGLADLSPSGILFFPPQRGAA